MSYKQYRAEIFVIQSDNLCILNRNLNPLKYIVITNLFGRIDTILVFCIFLLSFFYSSFSPFYLIEWSFFFFPFFPFYWFVVYTLF